MPASESRVGSDERPHSAKWSIEVADRLIQQWWNRGWSWWWPSHSGHRGNWNSNILYIVEGYKSSAGAYRSALEGERLDKGGVAFNPLSLFSTVGDILTALMVWEICSGIVALSLSSGQNDLSIIANRRGILYVGLSATGSFFSTIWFLAPDLTPGPFVGAIAGALLVYAVAGMIAFVLIMALLRRAADSL